MPSIQDEGYNEAIDGMLAVATYISAWDTFSTEVTGGSYARQAVTWDADTTARINDNTAELTIPIPVSTTVQFLGLDTAVSAGTNLVKVPVNCTQMAPVYLNPTTDVVTWPAHGLIADDRVVIFTHPGDTLPAGITEGTVYFVITAGLGTDVFQFATTSEGTAITWTTEGLSIAANCNPEVFASAGNLIVAAGAFDVTADPN